MSCSNINNDIIYKKRKSGVDRICLACGDKNSQIYHQYLHETVVHNWPLANDILEYIKVLISNDF